MDACLTRKPTLSIILIALLSGGLLFSLSAAAVTQQQLDSARSRGLAWLVTHQVGDGSWNDGAGLPEDTTAMALLALSRAGMTNSYVSSSAATYLGNRTLYSTDTVARSATALSKLRVDITAPMAQLLAMRSSSYGTVWGSYTKSAPSIIDTALALEAYNETGVTYASADTTTGLNYLTNNYRSDGGLPYNTKTDRDGVSHLIPTAHVVRVLAKYRRAGYTSADPAIDAAVNWLVAHQRSDGGFSEDASATVSSNFDSALVYAALNEARSLNVSGSAALGTAATTAFNNVASYLVAQQSGDGSWNGNALITASVMNAWPTTTLTDTDKDGIPDVVETVLGTNPNVADTRNLAKGNGLGVSGNNYATSLGAVDAGISLAKTLGVPAGVTGTQWTLQSGALPAGVGLNTATGQLSGYSTAGGLYNFTYKVTGSDGQTYVLAAQLTINPVDLSRDTPFLPPWGLALLASLLAKPLLHRSRRRVSHV